MDRRDNARTVGNRSTMIFAMDSPMETQDPFDILGLPARFDLPEALIERSYLKRSAMLHPDMLKDGEENGEALSAALNRARELLLHQESRADALLMRLGGPSREQERGLPAGFLPEILDVRERVESAVMQGDHAEVARWQQWALAERARHASEVLSLFSSEHEPGVRTTIRTILNAWRYIERLIEHIDPSSAASRHDERTA
jgi:molecular chaperone HscB